MKRNKPFYSGNYPNSPNYDPNLPLGWNKWDAMEAEDDIEEDEEIEEEKEEEWEKE